MVKTLEITVYEFDELDHAAQQRACEWFSQSVFEYDWWDSIYDDAERIGLKITSFDTDRNLHAKGEVITSCPEIAEAITKEHGAMCDTYHAAQQYIKDYAELEAEIPYDDIDELPLEYDDKRDALDNAFLYELLNCYARMLQKEAEYMLSEEYLSEGIRANEYTFTKEGKRFG